MNTTDPTNSRKTFYAAAAIFDSDVSASAKLVLLYLSRVANREGVCFPSLATIGEHCGYSKNTVRKALAELEQAGLLTMERGYQTTHNGRTRCTCNTYTILMPTKERCPTAAAEPEGVQPVHGEGAAVEREINNNSNLTIAHRDHSLSLEETDPELALIFDKIQLHLYEDKTFSAMMEHVITQMYHADGIYVKKRFIPQGAVRNVLSMLTIDHIDYIQRQLNSGVANVRRGEPYVMSCIYNAPIDCTVSDMRFLSQFRQLE